MNMLVAMEAMMMMMASLGLFRKQLGSCSSGPGDDDDDLDHNVDDDPDDDDDGNFIISL